MARFTKTRTAKPLAEGILQPSWRKNGTKESFSLIVQAAHTPQGEARFLSLDVSLDEARRFVEFAAPYLVTPSCADNFGLRKPSDVANALRKLAEEIEGKA